MAVFARHEKCAEDGERLARIEQKIETLTSLVERLERLERRDNK